MLVKGIVLLTAGLLAGGALITAANVLLQLRPTR